MEEWEEIVEDIEKVVSEDINYEDGGIYWKAIEGFLNYADKNKVFKLVASSAREFKSGEFCVYMDNCSDIGIGHEYFFKKSAIIEVIKEMNHYPDGSYKKEDIKPFVDLFQSMADELKQLIKEK